MRDRIGDLLRRKFDLASFQGLLLQPVDHLFRNML